MHQTTHPTHPSSGKVLLATLLLPGMAVLASAMPQTAVAENAPEKATIALKYGSYEDSQPGWNRIKVSAPQAYVQLPIAGAWALEASGVIDNVSGATPYAHTQQAGASGGGKLGMHDDRKAGDIKVTRYLPRAAVSASLAYSTEHDYTSHAVGLDARWSTDDNNRTWSAGIGFSSDRIDNTSSGLNTAVNEQKTSRELMAGITQILTPDDIVQVNLTRSMGSGYYNDPYKSYDLRPSKRDAWIALGRWNHYLASYDAALRSRYRFYSDTFGVQSSTLSFEWAQPLKQWTVTPGLRYYSQSAAHFYFSPAFDSSGQYDGFATLMRAAALPGEKSADQRLAAFGALTFSLKVSYAINQNTSADLKLESYRQASSLHWEGTGSPGLEPLNAQFYQVGITHRF